METLVQGRGRVRDRVARVKAAPTRLSEVKGREYAVRASTGIEELDRVLGGGMIPGMVTLIAGEPGIGKSTLLLQIAQNVQGKVIYIAGEESAGQIANRASRLGIKGDNILVVEETDVDAILEQVEQVVKVEEVERESKSTPTTFTTFSTFLIVDSIQTLTTQDLTGTAGSVGQVRECSSRITSFAKQQGIPVFIVGHVTKEGSIAGPRVLEHIVDTVLWFEGDRRQLLRVVRAIKNRFGPTDEVGLFSMEEKGLVGLPGYPLALEEKDVPGSVTTVILEGTRPMLVEIEALVAPTKLAFPKRVSSGVDQRRLEIIIAVLSRRCGLPLGDFDVFVNVAGRIRVTDPGADLGIALAIASSFKDNALGKVAVAGEVGILGSIREVPQLERRIKEAKRLGFEKVLTAREARTVSEAIRKFIKVN